MKERFKNLNIYYRVSIYSLILLAFFILALSFLFFLGYLDIPFGIILGSLISISSYFGLGLLEVKNKRDTKGIGGIVVSVARFVVLAAALIISGWLYYEKNIRIFNIFGIVGGYTYPLLVLLFFTVRQKKEQ